MNLELACGKFALNVSENIMAVTALVSSNSGLHPVFLGSLLIHRHLNLQLCSGPNMHKQKNVCLGEMAFSVKVPLTFVLHLQLSK